MSAEEDECVVASDVELISEIDSARAIAVDDDDVLGSVTSEGPAH